MFDFKLDDIEDVSFDLLPKGEYEVQVEKAEVQDTKDGEGKYIAIELTVVGEECNGRKVFEMFNVVNKSEKAENIGKGMLKQLIVASGADIEVFTDADQLIGLEMSAKVVIKKGTGDYDDKNEVKKYFASEGDAVGGEENPATETTKDPDGTSSADVFD